MARRPGGVVLIRNGQFQSVKGVARLQKLIAAIPDELVGPVERVLNGAGETLVQKIKSVVPVGDDAGAAGNLRDSVRREKGRAPLSVAVIEDGRDDEGKAFAAHVEHGHKAPDGSHVPAYPHFWPAVRVEKKRIRTRMASAVRQGVKAAVAKGHWDGVE